MNRYYFLNRPPSIGTHPPGEGGRKVFDFMQEIPGTERYAHGWVEYSEPLDFALVWKYELFPGDPQEMETYWDWRDENEI
jgi:hypothetical protein